MCDYVSVNANARLCGTTGNKQCAIHPTQRQPQEARRETNKLAVLQHLGGCGGNVHGQRQSLKCDSKRLKAEEADMRKMSKNKQRIQLFIMS